MSDDCKSLCRKLGGRVAVGDPVFDEIAMVKKWFGLFYEQVPRPRFVEMLRRWKECEGSCDLLDPGPSRTIRRLVSRTTQSVAGMSWKLKEVSEQTNGKMGWFQAKGLYTSSYEVQSWTNLALPSNLDKIPPISKLASTVGDSTDILNIYIEAHVPSSQMIFSPKFIKKYSKFDYEGEVLRISNVPLPCTFNLFLWSGDFKTLLRLWFKDARRNDTIISNSGSGFASVFRKAGFAVG